MRSGAAASPGWQHLLLLPAAPLEDRRVMDGESNQNVSIILTAGPSHLQVQLQPGLFSAIPKGRPLFCGEGWGKGEHCHRARDGNKNQGRGEIAWGRRRSSLTGPGHGAGWRPQGCYPTGMGAGSLHVGDLWPRQESLLSKASPKGR